MLIYSCCDGDTVINELTPKNVEHTNKVASGNQCEETKERLKEKAFSTQAQKNSSPQTKAAFTSSSSNREEDKIRAPQTEQQPG